MRYLEALLGLALVVISTVWGHHLLMTGVEVSWLYFVPGIAFFVGLFLCVPRPTRQIAKQLRNALPFLDNTCDP